MVIYPQSVLKHVLGNTFLFRNAKNGNEQESGFEKYLQQ